ncbi:bifunctional phosphopantothenoylcysteine decarboxylase/phosphopantothenate--cysteine ligase CoaBC [Brevibacterium album]|uniref:bifunctional phosphopantothenoylcysteine decarboxylase/phosphopantothenate--cysteine ligase CoaBC n=1 Tax=Brevibacterium album TaxID=417948 RepID=UPI00041E9437|nr:bifunctional phosphopantothenoylcysteine decarboxylase/phosphopantothenate--cysteine ligase CoaBC [Brevibacterium album]
MRIVLGVSGGIAAYKAAHVLRGLRERGHEVRVVPTRAALRFVGAPTWEALSGQPVAADVFERVDEVEHVRVGHEADLVVLAPATADLLARARAGLADDMLTATLLTATCPVVAAPAMHTQMWEHPATVENVAVLRERGWTVIEPDSGRLTGSDSGPGRLPEPEAIIGHALAAAGEGPGPGAEARTAGKDASGPLAGLTVAVSAGGTRERLDPVRFLGNRSSGKQGAALAAAAAEAGAEVVLVSANVDSAVLAGLPAGVRVDEVESTEELFAAMAGLASDADVMIMAAAVADYRPAAAAEHKLKKSGQGLSIELVENPDVLAALVAARAEGRSRSGQTLVGFAAETGSPEKPAAVYAQEKLLRKGCDLLVFNDVSEARAFGTEDNEITVYRPAAGRAQAVATASGSKREVSEEVMAAIVAERNR